MIDGECDQRAGRVIIAGFGVPGRVVADLLESRGIPHCIIELNALTCDRCKKSGVPIHVGDVTQPQTLRDAGIDNASMIIIAIPDEKAALEATRQARLLNPHIPIVTRTHYISAGMTARALGANEVIVAEQVVAAEMSNLVRTLLEPQRTGSAAVS
jgi:voltage-gated potassium channel Kch